MNYIRLHLALCCLLSTSVAYSQEMDTSAVSVEARNAFLQFQITKVTMGAIQQKTANALLNAESADVTGADRQCITSYSRLFQNETIKIGVFLGYLDTHELGTVEDPITREAFEAVIQEPCINRVSLCGFRRDVEVRNQFYKHMKILNQEKTVLIKMYSPALTTSYQNNINRSNALLQRMMSNQVFEDYKKALQEDDVVIYSGHARYGTGPGFRPLPHYSVDWFWTMIAHPQLRAMKAALQQSRNKPKILGMLVCHGAEYYGRMLQETAPDSGYILTRQTMAGTDTDNQIFASINGLLETQCSDGFRDSMTRTTRQFFHNPRLDSPQTRAEKIPVLVNFFEPLSNRMSRAWYFSPRMLIEDQPFR